MIKRSVLVTAVGGDIGQNVVRCLRENDGGYDFHIRGCDMDRYAAGRALVDRFIVAPSAGDAKSYGAFLHALLSREEPDYAILISEPELRYYDSHRSEFRRHGTRIVAHNNRILGAFLDKYKTVRFLERRGIACPRTFRLEEYDGQLKYPVMLKERSGYGGKGLIRIADEEELIFYAKRSSGTAILQEYINDDGGEYTATVFGHKQRYHSIAFKRKLGYGSLTKVAELATDEKLARIVESIGRASRLEGSLNVQARKRRGEYVVFEINPRISSTVRFRHHFGFRDVVWWIDILEGRSVSFRLKYARGVGTRSVSEVFFDLGNRRRL
jgi:carbamoyl-phosphate synthase large subunit